MFKNFESIQNRFLKEKYIKLRILKIMKKNAEKLLKSGNRNRKEKKNKVIFDKGKFTFQNCDIYEGEYKLEYDQVRIVKQGRGVYTTDNFDVYDGAWDDDAYAEDKIYIRYNNNAEFRGNIDSKGTMNGPGAYIFPDGSSIEANWLNNKPFTNIIYRESLGFKWILESLSENMISFSPGNHFWDDMVFYQITDHTDNETTESI